jgi:hypothetical protein
LAEDRWPVADALSGKSFKPQMNADERRLEAVVMIGDGTSSRLVMALG